MHDEAAGVRRESDPYWLVTPETDVIAGYTRPPGRSPSLVCRNRLLACVWHHAEQVYKCFTVYDPDSGDDEALLLPSLPGSHSAADHEEVTVLWLDLPQVE